LTGLSIENKNPEKFLSIQVGNNALICAALNTKWSLSYEGGGGFIFYIFQFVHLKGT